MRLGRRTSQRIVVVTTDRHGLCRPILMQFLLLLSSLPSTASMTDSHRHNVEGLHSKTLQLLEYRYLDYFSELHDEPARRTVIDMTDRHKLRNPTLGQTSPSSFSSCTTLQPTDRHKHDGPSQAL
ncbi:hypothetical protein EJD97_021789 [Solanum chilense]|uniref:Secreted protein n=1 Tax=Solanum chilense TaxID=4083 RepID=A0A6N2AD98_SOLCI|nr:hypothetical protein EJD97_021789 [Solanum chilense]